MKGKVLIFVLVIILFAGLVILVNNVESSLIPASKLVEKDVPDELPIFMADSTSTDNLYFNVQFSASMPAKNNEYAQEIGLVDSTEYSIVQNRITEFFDFLEQGQYDMAFSLVSPAFLSYKGISDVKGFIDYTKEKGMDNATCTIISGSRYDKYQVFNVSLVEPLQPELVDEFLIRNKAKIANQTIIYMPEKEEFEFSFEGYIGTVFNDPSEDEITVEKIDVFHDKFIVILKATKEEEPLEKREIKITIREGQDRIVDVKSVQIPLEDALLKVACEIRIETAFNIRYNDTMKIEVSFEQ